MRSLHSYILIRHHPFLQQRISVSKPPKIIYLVLGIFYIDTSGRQRIVFMGLGMPDTYGASTGLLRASQALLTSGLYLTYARAPDSILYLATIWVESWRDINPIDSRSKCHHKRINGNGRSYAQNIGHDKMTLDHTQVNTLWEQGFRPYEIYVYNQTPTDYFGETVGAGTVAGWDIKHVFSTRELLKAYPYFDAVIGLSDMSVCEEIWEG